MDVEARVLDPRGAGGVARDALAEALVLQQLVFDAAAELRIRDFRMQQPDADDHHQVDVVIHAQPCGIDARHAFPGGEVHGLVRWKEGS